MELVKALEKLKNISGDQYIFVTPDSVFADSYTFNSVQYEKEMREFEKQIRDHEEKIKQFTLNIKFDSTFIHSAQMNDAQNFKVMLDSNICRVDIPSIEIPEAPFPEIAAIEPLIEQATNNIHFYAYKIPKIEKSKSGLKIEYFNDDSVQYASLSMIIL